MPLLEAEANKLTNPSLVTGVIDKFRERGAIPLLNAIGFKPYQGSQYDFVLEDTLPSGSSARSPYGETPLPNGVGTNNRVSVKAGYFARNADTAEIDMKGKSDLQDLHASDMDKATKKLTRDWRLHFLHGNGSWNEGTGYNLCGLDYFLDKMTGKYVAGSRVAGAWADEQDLKMFGTDNGTPGGTAQNLDLPMLEDFISRPRGLDIDVIYCDRRTYVEYKNILNATPGGNTAAMIMSDMFERPMLTVGGIPIIILDTVGREKTSDFDAAASASISAGGTLTINTAVDKYFLGFSDFDSNRSFTLYDGNPNDGASVLYTGTIETINGDFSVETDDASGVAKGPGYLVLHEKPAMYGVRFDETDGVAAIYHADDGAPVSPPSDYEGAVAGFSVAMLGKLEDLPLVRSRIQWFGNFVNHDPQSVIRLTDYNIATI